MQKKCLNLFILSRVMLLAGCSAPTPSQPEATPPVEPQYTCKGENYYTSLTGQREFLLSRDEAESGFSASIPELCVKLISRPRDTTLSLQEWKEYNEHPTYGPQEILRGTLSGNQIILGARGQVHYRIEDKNKEMTLAQAIESKYTLKANCTLEKDTDLDGQKQALYARGHIFGESDEASRYTLNMHDQGTCSSSYPVEEIGFGEVLPYDILYSDKYDTRYLLYNLSVTQEGSSPFLNMTFKYTD